MTTIPNKEPEQGYPVKDKPKIDWRAEGYKPGQTLPNGGWVQWRPSDLDPDDIVTFVVQEVPSLQMNQLSVNGKRVLKVDINDLVALYEVGALTKSNRYFYNAYCNALDQMIASEDFKCHGPARGVPWRGRDNKSTWLYIPEAYSFGLDLDGRYLKYKEWYEFDENGIPIAINNVKKLATLYFAGDIDLNLTKIQVAELLFEIIKGRIMNVIRRIRRNVQRKAK